jgi:hypothetical protein
MSRVVCPKARQRGRPGRSTPGASALCGLVVVLLASAGSGCGQPQAAPASWSTVSSPNPAGGTNVDLDSVTCVSAGHCWAVGFYAIASGSSTKYQTLIEQESASAWTIVSSPTPIGASDELLYAVTCASADDCWAVGSYTDAAGAGQTLIEQDTGNGWTVVSSPTPSGGTNVGLDGVACAGAGDCWAVGSYTVTGNSFQTLIEEDAGNGWSIVSSPHPSGMTGELFGVTCVGANDCWAVGGSSTAAAGASPSLVEQDTGSGWTIVSSPTPAHGTDAELSGVACAGASDCWAAGSDADASGNSQSLIERNTGRGWTIESSPKPSGGAADDLNGVTCEGATDCWAVGSYTDSIGNSPTLAEQSTGDGWSIASSPDPPTSTGSALQSVSCVNASECWAVGSSTDTGGNTQTLVAQT